MTLAPDSKVTPKAHVHARRFDDELVILDLEGGNYFSLDNVGAEMWDGFLEGLSLIQVAQRLVPKYQVSEERLLGDACDLAMRLSEAGLALIEAPP